MTSTSSNVIIRRDIWQTFWLILTSDRLITATLLGLIILLVLSTLLPQTPQDTSAYSRWLSDVQTRFGGASSILATLGLFDIAHSLLFRALAALLGMMLVLRLLERFQELRDTARGLPPPETLTHHIDSDQPANALAQRLQHYRLHVQDDITIADRYPWANWANIVATGGVLLILIGLLLSTLSDWHVDALSVAPDALAPIVGTSYRLRSTDIGEAGEVDLVLMQNEQIIAEGHAQPGQPLIVRDIQFYVQDVQPALRVSGQNEAGQSVPLQIRADSLAEDQLLLIFDRNRPDPSFAAPTAQLFIQIASTDSESYHVSVIGIADGKLIAEEDIRADGEIRVNNYRFAFVAASHALISAVYAPSQWVIALGTILVIAGLSIVALYPARRVWFTSHGNLTRIVCDDPDFDIDAWLGSTPS